MIYNIYYILYNYNIYYILYNYNIYILCDTQTHKKAICEMVSGSTLTVIKISYQVRANCSQKVKSHKQECGSEERQESVKNKAAINTGKKRRNPRIL